MAAVVPAHLHEIADRARPVALAREQVLPVVAALQPLLPGGALQRGTNVGLTGGAASSLALALAAGPSQAGSWVAVVGLGDLGLAAAAELGVALERLVLIDEPPAQTWTSVVAALVGAFDIVLTGPQRLRATEARRLAARSRERGSVLVQLGIDRSGRDGLELDVRFATGGSSWHGLGDGHGHLRARRVAVEVTGRRRAAQPRRAELWLPGPDGRVALAAPEHDPGHVPERVPSPVTHLRYHRNARDHLHDRPGAHDRTGWEIASPATRSPSQFGEERRLADRSAG